jgi:glycosyltransferase involved in cell wall biosynthesis
LDRIVRVSIVIPLFNKEHWLRRALDSIAQQTFDDFELIVVDDGSTDNGARVVSDYGDSRFRLIAQSNAGPGAARNRGIAEAKGDFLAFLDADDEWCPTYLEDSVRLLDGYGENVASITSGYVECPTGVLSSAVWRARGITEGISNLHPDTAPLLAVHRLTYMSPWSTMVRAQQLHKWGGFYSRDKCLYGEDSYLWLKILLNETVAFSLEPRVRFHADASELSKNLEGPRPVEPFLRAPSEIHAACPPPLRRLLSRILAIRAFKTCCMLGYWGHWRDAKVLKERFLVPGAWKLPYYLSASVCSTPVGAYLGNLARKWKPKTGR